MEHSFPVDEVVPSPLSTTLQPAMQPPQVGGDCGGGVVSCEDATGGDARPPELSPLDEWSFERLLEEELMKNNDTTPADSGGGSALYAEPAVPEAVEVEVEPPAATTADPVEYNAMLKRKLEEDLNAIAMWRASSTVHPESSQGSHPYNGDLGNMSLVQNAYISSKFPACSSSMAPSPSDDDDMDGEVEILGLRTPDPEKVKKRKESNRESARRSRTRKAAHMKDLEDQVTHLRVENSLLLTRLDAINQKYNACAVDNRILRAEMETLRTKVMMAEDTVNRLIGTSPSLPSNVVVTDTPSLSRMPFVGSPSHPTPPDPSSSVPIIQDNNITNNYYYAAAAATAAAPDAARVNNGYLPMAAAPSPLLQTGGVVNGSSNDISRINSTAASHCETTTMEELLQEGLTAMPMSSSSGGEEAAPWELSAPPGLDEVNNDANMEGHEDQFGNVDILG